MASRHVCPSTGVLRRTFVADTPRTSNGASRAFCNSARRLEEKPSDAPAGTRPAPTRKDRSEIALKQITNLGQRRVIPGARAKGSFPSGQSVRRTFRPQTNADINSSIAPNGSSQNAGPRSANDTSGLMATRSSAPLGQMVRAPSQLRITRTPVGNATVGTMRGPNLRGRDGNRARGPGGPRGGRRDDDRPKMREKDKDAGSAVQRTGFDDVPASDTLSDGMVQHLLRIQRKEWDRVPYEPKYAQGSFAANELIYTGRELFRGEVPPVKIWGPLERRIGLVGMFGAEAHLKIRRVGDGDPEPFGQEVPEEEADEEAKGSNKETAVR